MREKPKKKKQFTQAYVPNFFFAGSLGQTFHHKCVSLKLREWFQEIPGTTTEISNQTEHFCWDAIFRFFLYELSKNHIVSRESPVRAHQWKTISINDSLIVRPTLWCSPFFSAVFFRICSSHNKKQTHTTLLFNHCLFQKHTLSVCGNKLNFSYVSCHFKMI